MNIHFLGTAASEGFPNVFCRCDACHRARSLGGKNIRTRSSVIIDKTLKIDFPSDSHMQALRDGINLGEVEHLLITHTHYDHLFAGDLESRMKGFAHGVPYPLHIYGNSLVLDHCRRYDLHLLNGGEDFKLHCVETFTPYQMGEATVTPLLANHDPLERCLLYFIEKAGKTILYANDSGWFPKATWEWLKGKSIDVAILDCTVGQNNNEYSTNHMSVETVMHVKKRLLQYDCLHKKSQVFATHISHNSGMLYEDLVEVFAEDCIQVAYDGLAITI